ncbi:hypothetical protein [Pontibacter sp. H249]|uniref:hypothetical protein n=1 Tax=Pontibacter sp. H249 TaxID=3133420 RepID=UPI0030C2B54C
MLNKIASALDVTAEAIKNFSEDGDVFNIQHMQGHASAGSSFNQCTFNPLDKLIEVMDENKKLYERLLASEREKIEILIQQQNS